MGIEAILYLTMLGGAVLSYILILCSIPRRRKKILLKAGACIMRLCSPSSKKWILIAVFSGLLILVVPLRNFGWFVNIVLLGVALLSAEISAREAAGCGKAGVYENMLISSTNATEWNAILSLPTLAYEDNPETSHVDKTTLKIITKTGSDQLIVFESEDERKKAVEEILKLVPRLSPS